MTQKNKKIITGILMSAILLTLCFIFGNSMDSKEVSGQKSAIVKEVVDAVAEALGSEEKVTEHTIRKLAHYLEFSLLGVELAAFCVLWKRPLVYAAFSGLLVALSDETIQIFSNRGSSVLDVWLDFSGVVTGLLFFCGICRIYGCWQKSIVKKV